LDTSGPLHLYDNIGAGYDATRRADPYISDCLARHLAVADGEVYLDVACGTGNYAAALASRGGKWYGVDQSRRMTNAARQKTDAVAWHLADVAALPFSNGVFSGVLCTNAIHHFAALERVFSEVYRVLTQGRFVIFTATREQTRGYWLNEYFPDAMRKSVEQTPDLFAVQETLTRVGFSIAYTETYEVQPDLQDFFLYSGKYRPEIYLSESVRMGISTFASLADPSEVQMGCQRLRIDIDSGRIAEVIKAYQHGKGDYLFIVVAKGILDGWKEPMKDYD
jgi:ubiquinone/menaquinone biosynthesis C-methylase UbiE